MSKRIEYKKYITSKEWKKKREQLFEERGRECEQCGSKKKTQVHHLTYDNLGNEPLKDLQILCYMCHISKHDEYFEKFVLKLDPLKKGQIRLTKELIDGLRTRRGGFIAEVVKTLNNGKKNVKKGWARKLIGKPFNILDYNYLKDTVKKYDEERDAQEQKEKAFSSKGLPKEIKQEQTKMIKDLRSAGISSINGKSLSYIPIVTLKKLHAVYC